MRTVIVFSVIAVAVSVCDAQWVQTSLDNVNVYCFAIKGTYLYAGTERGGVFLSTNNGTNWTAVNSGLTDTNVYTLGVSATNLFAGTFFRGAFLSTNNGTSWTAVNNGLPRRPYDTSSYYPITCFAVNGTNLFAGTNLGVFRSTNNGTSWTAVNTGLTDSGNVMSLAVSGTNLFAGTYYGGVFLSTNNGTSWTLVGTGIGFGAASLAVSSTMLFAGTDLGVFRSTNNGTSWVAAGLVHISALAVSGTNLFAGSGYCGPRSCHDSLFVSTNNGTSWTEVDSGLTNTYVWCFAVSDTNLFAGLISAPFIGGPRGVWRRPLSEMITSVSPAAPLPTEFLLEQNYPNPWNASTTLRYGLPHTSFVTLTIYNTLGQQVAQLVNEQQQAGYHDVVFRGDGLASGVYFYRIQAGSIVDVKKFVLLK
jgi:hypothetical protein